MSYQEHASFSAPSNKSARIWRYIGFTKLVSMLEHKGLFLASGDHLGDPFEGSIAKTNQENERWRFPNITMKGSEFEQWKKHDQHLRHMTKINCWHINDHESAAMWSLYSRTNEAVAIQSTYSRLRECFKQPVHIGVVNYIDYETDSIPEGNNFTRFLYKRRSFEHEKELRVVWMPTEMELSELRQAGESHEFGIWRNASLKQLIQCLHVSPTSPPWFKELVEKVIARYGLRLRVSQSSLDNKPLF